MTRTETQTTATVTATPNRWGGTDYHLAAALASGLIRITNEDGQWNVYEMTTNGCLISSAHFAGIGAQQTAEHVAAYLVTK